MVCFRMGEAEGKALAGAVDQSAAPLACLLTARRTHRCICAAPPAAPPLNP
jgi:hypothetical protein